MAARYIQDPAQILLPLCTGDPFLIVARPPNSGVTFHKFTPASLVPVQLDLGFLGANRDMLTIYNTSDKDLYVKLGPSPTLTSFTTVLSGDGSKGPKFWSLPQSWIFYGGPVWGFWPENPGNGGAMLTELT